MTAVFKREFMSYFLSPIGYIFIFFFMFINAFFFVMGPLQYQSADVNGMLSNISVMLLFLVPVLTMRLISEEKSRKTDQLLYTSPVSITGIVIGKYLAAFSVFMFSLALSFILPAILFIFGKPPVGETIGAYIGFILLWAAFIAIGIFISSLTESQIIAAVSTFAVLILIYIIDGVASMVPEAIGNGIKWFSLMGRFYTFMTGLLDLTNIVYYLSFTAIFLFLTVRTIEKSRYS